MFVLVLVFVLVFVFVLVLVFVLVFECVCVLCMLKATSNECVNELNKQMNVLIGEPMGVRLEQHIRPYMNRVDHPMI